MIDSQAIMAIVAVLTAICALYVWATRLVVGKEIHRAMREEVAPYQQDVEVLRVAVFNHVSHGQKPSESNIREVLGYGPRRS